MIMIIVPHAEFMQQLPSEVSNKLNQYGCGCTSRLLREDLIQPTV